MIYMSSPEKFRSQLPENESQNDLQSIDLGELTSSIEEYNRQFNWGAIAGRELRKVIDQDEENPPHRQTLSVEEIEKMHELALEKTGLSLEPIKGIATLYSGGEEIPSSEMRMNVANGKKFVEYLNVLDEHSLTENQMKGLKTVAESFVSQLTQQYELGNPNDERTINLFANLDEIIKEYKRLDETNQTGLASSVERLGLYLDIARQGYLREYILAENERLLATPDNKVFGPSEWWADSTPESLKEHYWEKAIEHTKKIGQNPKAQKLYTQVVENLKASLRYNKEELKRIDKDLPNRKVFEEKLIVVDEMYEILEKM